METEPCPRCAEEETSYTHCDSCGVCLRKFVSLDTDVLYECPNCKETL